MKNVIRRLTTILNYTTLKPPLWRTAVPEGLTTILNYTTLKQEVNAIAVNNESNYYIKLHYSQTSNFEKTPYNCACI